MFNISDVTITKTYKKIYPFQQIVINDELTNKTCHKINLKYITDNFEAEELPEEIELEDSDTESETEILIKKLHSQSDNKSVKKNIIIKELDESDIVKKDNSQTKQNKILLQTKEKERKKLEKEKLKEEKEKMKLIDKKNKKKNKTEILDEDESSKKKRGRPKKIIIVV